MEEATLTRLWELEPDWAFSLDGASPPVAGSVYHVRRNWEGGATYTPVGQFFVARKPYEDDICRDHWRVDCYFHKRHLPMASPAKLAPLLIAALQDRRLIEEPIWLEWHVAETLGYEQFGDISDPTS